MDDDCAADAIADATDAVADATEAAATDVAAAATDVAAAATTDVVAAAATDVAAAAATDIVAAVSASSSSSSSSSAEAPPYTGDFGEYFSQQYSLVKTVLSYLNYYDLNALRDVNAPLRAAADILLRKRTWIQCASLNYLHGTDHRPPRPAAHGGRFVDLRIEPKVLFTFEGMAGGPSSRSRPKICMRLRDRHHDSRFFPRAEIVPRSVQAFVPVGAKGVIYPERNDKNELVAVQTMVHKKLVLLYMPASDRYDVAVYTHVVATDAFDLDPIQAYFTADPRPIRGLIFLKVGAPHADGIITYIVRVVSNNQSEPFALSGGHVSSLDYDSPPKKNIPGVIKAIIFRGDGVRCVSDFIGSTTDDGVVEGLKHTSAYVSKTFGQLDVNKTFIMMFQCLDRHSLPIEDYTHLSNTFPNIPIVGVQTWGEIGYRSFKTQDFKYVPKKRKLSIMHSVKTTYMIISID